MAIGVQVLTGQVMNLPHAVGFGLGLVGTAYVVALIPAGIYWLFKRRRMPGLTWLIWIIWGLAALATSWGNLIIARS